LARFSGSTGQASCAGYQGKSFMIYSAKGYDADFKQLSLILSDAAKCDFVGK
jgi:hypothetical protein